jgi:hypothetical protein
MSLAESTSRFPRIVGADVPEMTFRIAAGKISAAVTLVFDLDHNFRACSFGAQPSSLPID